MGNMHPPIVFMNALDISRGLRILQLQKMFGDDPLGLLRKAFDVLLGLRFNLYEQVPSPF